MIESFKHKGLQELFEKGNSAKLQKALAERALRRLDAIDIAKTPAALNVPGFGTPRRAKALQRACQWAVVHYL